MSDGLLAQPQNLHRNAPRGSTEQFSESFSDAVSMEHPFHGETQDAKLRSLEFPMDFQGILQLGSPSKKTLQTVPKTPYPRGYEAHEYGIWEQTLQGFVQR